MAEESVEQTPLLLQRNSNLNENKIATSPRFSVPILILIGCMISIILLAFASVTFRPTGSDDLKIRRSRGIFDKPMIAQHNPSAAPCDEDHPRCLRQVFGFCYQLEDCVNANTEHLVDDNFGEDIRPNPDSEDQNHRHYDDDDRRRHDDTFSPSAYPVDKPCNPSTQPCNNLIFGICFGHVPCPRPRPIVLTPSPTPVGSHSSEHVDVTPSDIDSKHKPIDPVVSSFSVYPTNYPTDQVAVSDLPNEGKIENGK